MTGPASPTASRAATGPSLSGNGYYGGLQFSLGTWRAYGGTGMPNEKPAWYQATIAERIRVRSGLDHWPGCGAYYG